MNTIVPKGFDRSVAREGKVQTRQLIERKVDKHFNTVYRFCTTHAKNSVLNQWGKDRLFDTCCHFNSLTIWGKGSCS